jgi:serine/threonine protein kinase
MHTTEVELLPNHASYNWTKSSRTYEGTHPVTEQKMVAKPIEPHELEIARHVIANPSPNIVKMSLYSIPEIGTCLVMDHKDALADHLPTENDNIAVVSRQILSGILHCKTIGIVHHDIKLSNICWDETFGAQLIDFSISAEYSSENPEFECTFMCTETGEHSCVPDKLCSAAVDIYQFGLLLAQLWMPQSGPELIWNQKRCSHFQQNLQTYFDRVANPNSEKDKLALDLIMSMVVDDPQKRITVEEALNHKYLEL